jgi:hypothetical protein
MSAGDRGDTPSPHRKVNLLLPGQVIRYTHSFFLGDRFELPGGTKVSLWHLVGFKLQLASSVVLPPLEDAAVRRRPLGLLRSDPCVRSAREQAIG